MTPLDHIMSIAWPVFVILSCVISWTAQEVLYRKIKERYYDKWVAIGEPGFRTAFSNDFSKFKKDELSFKYLLRGDVDLDKDLEIKKLKILNQIIFIIVLFCVVLFIISSIVFNYA